MFATAGNCIKFLNIGDHNELSVASQLNENGKQLSFSCDGNYLASLSKTCSEISLNVISGHSGAKVILSKFIDNPKCVQFTNLSTRFLGACGSNNVLIWDLKGSNIKKDFKIPGKANFLKISFSSSDSHTAAATRKGNLFLLSNSNNSISDPIKIFDEETELTGLQYSRHSQFTLVASCQRGTVAVVDTKMGQVTKSFRHTHKAPVSSLIFSPLNEFLVSSVGYDKKLAFYNLNVKNVISSCVKQEPLTSAAFHPNGKYIVLGSITGNVELLDLRMLSESMSVVKAYDEAVTDIKFQPILKSKTKMKSGHSQPSRNITISAPELKENVAPDTSGHGDKAEDRYPELFSPIRNVETQQITRRRSDKNRSLLGGTQPKANQSFPDLLSPLKMVNTGQISINYNVHNASSDDLLSPLKIASPDQTQTEFHMDGNNSFEGILLSPVRNKEDTFSTTISTDDLATSSIPVIHQVDYTETTLDKFHALAMPGINKEDSIEANFVSRHNITSCVSQQNVPNSISQQNVGSCVSHKNVADSINQQNFANYVSQQNQSNIVSQQNLTNVSPTLEAANTCCNANLSIVQNYIRSEFENHEMKTNQRLMDLHFAVYKQFYVLKNEMAQMMEENKSIYSELINENIELKQEIQRLRSNY